MTVANAWGDFEDANADQYRLGHTHRGPCADCYVCGRCEVESADNGGCDCEFPNCVVATHPRGVAYAADPSLLCKALPPEHEDCGTCGKGSCGGECEDGYPF